MVRRTRDLSSFDVRLTCRGLLDSGGALENRLLVRPHAAIMEGKAQAGRDARAAHPTFGNKASKLKESHGEGILD